MPVRFPTLDIPGCLENWTHLLTHWGRVTHICVSKLTIIGSDNGLSPGRRQAIIWTNAGVSLIGHFNEISIEIHTFFIKENTFENVVWKMEAIVSQPQCANRNSVTLEHIMISEGHYQSFMSSLGTTWSSKFDQFNTWWCPQHKATLTQHQTKFCTRPVSK